MSLASHIIELSSTAPPGPRYPGTPHFLAQQADVNTGSLRKWIEDNVVFTILILISCVLLLRGMKGNFSAVLTVGALSLFGLGFLGIATSSTAAQGIGTFLLGLLGIHTS